MTDPSALLDPPWVVLATAALALAVVASGRVWPYARAVVTIAHEGGHALAAVLTRRRLAGIRLHSDTSGVTVSAGKPTGPGMVATTAAGYVAPPLLGLAGSGMLAAERVTALLWVSIALLAAMLLAVRNAYGIVSVVVSGGIVFAVSWFTSAAIQAAFAYLITWFLLVAGSRPVVELQRLRRRGRAPHSDADQLARLTGAPGIVWVAAFGTVALGALLVGGWLLLDGAGVPLELPALSTP